MRQEFHFRKSRSLQLYLWLAHLLVLLATWLLPVPLWLSVTFTAALATSLYYSLLIYRNRPQMLACGDSWRLRQRDGHEQEVELCAPCYIGRWLTVVPVKEQGKQRYLMIPWDSLDSDNYRRLGVQLRTRV